jgi:iron-sulfur cluster repair protein YtfE (RIC family)
METMEAAALQMLRDTALMEALQADVERYAEAEDRPRTEDALTSLARSLRERVRLEEELLFPALEALVAQPHYRPTARLRRQHAVLLEILTGIERAVRSLAWATVHGDLRELKAALKAHVEEERGALFPLIGSAERGHA